VRFPVSNPAIIKLANIQTCDAPRDIVTPYGVVSRHVTRLAVTMSQKVTSRHVTGAGAWRPELVMTEPLKWYEEKAGNSPWINALAELRQRATREGYCYQHVQAITVAIDQYAEKALGNRDYFLNKPYGVG
jgi:hypothetical protein